MRRGGGAGARGHVGRAGSARSGGVSVCVVVPRRTVPPRSQTDLGCGPPGVGSRTPHLTALRSLSVLRVLWELPPSSRTRPGAGSRSSEGRARLPQVYTWLHPGRMCPGPLPGYSYLFHISCIPILERFGPLAMRPVESTGIQCITVSQETLSLQFRLWVELFPAVGQGTRKSQSPSSILHKVEDYSRPLYTGSI